MCKWVQTLDWYFIFMHKMEHNCMLSFRLYCLSLAVFQFAKGAISMYRVLAYKWCGLFARGVRERSATFSEALPSCTVKSWWRTGACSSARHATWCWPGAPRSVSHLALTASLSSLPSMPSPLKLLQWEPSELLLTF